MAAAERVELDWLDPATPRALRHALRDGNYHVLHYVGHSAFTASGDGMLYLEQETDGRSVGVDSTLFANLLSDQDRLRLVVLNSCEGARTTLTDPYAGVATTLIQLGVPAVVAMQFEISDDAALLFAEELYTNLVGRQDPIDAAVAEARKAVYTEIDAIEWATPVLFVRDPDVELFRFEVPAAPLPPPPPPDFDEKKSPRWVRPITKFAAWTHAGRGRCGGALAALAVARPRRGRVRRRPRSATMPARRRRRRPGRVPDGRPGRRRRRGDGGAAPAQRARHRRRGDGVLRRRDDGRRSVSSRRTSPTFPTTAILGPLTWSELVVTGCRAASGDAVRAAQTLLNDNGADHRGGRHASVPPTRAAVDHVRAGQRAATSTGSSTSTSGSTSSPSPAE